MYVTVSIYSNGVYCWAKPIAVRHSFKLGANIIDRSDCNIFDNFTKKKTQNYMKNRFENNTSSKNRMQFIAITKSKQNWVFD